MGDPQMYWYMPSINNAMSSLSLFLMIGTNRKYLIKMSYYVLERFCCECIVFQNERHLKNNTTSLSKGKDGTLHSFQDKSKIRLERTLSPEEYTSYENPSLIHNDSDIEVRYKSKTSVGAGAAVFRSDTYNLNVSSKRK